MEFLLGMFPGSCYEILGILNDPIGLDSYQDSLGLWKRFHKCLTTLNLFIPFDPVTPYWKDYLSKQCQVQEKYLQSVFFLLRYH